jgi:hypothetical protein
MRCHRQLVCTAPVLIVALICSAPAAEAGGAFGIHIGGGGFGVSVGFGDWGVYTSSWADPYWSINFDTSLSGYGNWVWVGGLGRVWRPWVASSWRPYTYGRWISTGWGLTWVAYEPWGYIPHHYGNWAYSSFGWVWVPGYSYSCANVTWVSSGTHVGWYARPPHGWSHTARGFRHGYRHGYRDGYDNGYWNGWHDARHATYVGWKHLGAGNVAHHTVTHRLASRRRIESLDRAPTSLEIRQNGGATITEARLAHRTVTMNGREITIARPEGMARSIERHAAESAGRALGQEALERRQPLVRARGDGTTGTARSSRSRTASREMKLPSVERLSRSSSSTRRGDSDISTRSPSKRPSHSHDSWNQIDGRPRGSSSQVKRRYVDVRQETPRTRAKFEMSDSQRTQRSPSTADRSSPSTPIRQVARHSQQLTRSRQPLQAPARQTAASSRRASPPREQASSQRQSRSGVERPSTARQKRAAVDKDTDPRSRRRQR